MKKQKFEYRTRDGKSTEKRAKQRGGMFDPIFKDQFPTFNPKAGDHCIRIMPPTWKRPEHYGLDVFLHYSIGAGNDRYLCLNKMKGEDCPICDEFSEAQSGGDDEYAKSLRPGKRVLVWVIDRNDEKAGPKLWDMPWTVDRDIAGLSIHKKTKAVLPIDNPDEGYDVEFTVEGEKLKKKYVQIVVSRDSTPLSDDEEQQEKWLQFITDNPLPDTLNYFDADHIAKAFAGKKKGDDEEDDDEDEDGVRTRSDRKSKRRDDDDDDDEPKRSKSKRSRDDDDDEEDDDEPDDDELDEPSDDDDADDEDEKPSKSKSKRRNDDEEEEDADDDDDDDDEPKRSKSKRSRDDDEEDEDDEDPKPSKSKSKRRDDDEDDDEPDDADDDDDDDDDEPKKGSLRDKVRKGIKGKRDDD